MRLITTSTRALARPRCTCSVISSQLRHAGSSSASSTGATVVDQTKQGNDPNSDKKEEHQQAAAQTTSSEGRDHPAKQPDPQVSPERSTGFETQGPGSEAGKGGEKEMGGKPHQEGGGEHISNYEKHNK